MVIQFIYTKFEQGGTELDTMRRKRSSCQQSSAIPSGSYEYSGWEGGQLLSNEPVFPRGEFVVVAWHVQRVLPIISVYKWHTPRWWIAGTWFRIQRYGNCVTTRHFPDEVNVVLHKNIDFVGERVVRGIYVELKVNRNVKFSGKLHDMLEADFKILNKVFVFRLWPKSKRRLRIFLFGKLQTYI